MSAVPAPAAPLEPTEPEPATERDGSIRGSIRPVEALETGSMREARARAREGNPEGPITQSNDAAGSESGEASSRGEGRAQAKAVAAVVAMTRRLLADFRPPEIWETPRPPLRDVWNYAAHAQWTGRTGAWRRAGQAYAIVVAIPAAAAGYLALWVLERPARVVCAVVLLTLTALTPPGGWLLETCLDLIRALVA